MTAETGGSSVEEEENFAALRGFGNRSRIAVAMKTIVGRTGRGNGALEGGDVLRVGKKIFVGFTARSNPEGIRQLAVIAATFGYDLTAVPVTGCLHLKSAVTYLGKNTLLGNRSWFDWKRLFGLDWIDVHPAEPHAANALAINDAIVFPASFPQTAALIREKGFRVELLDISELQKAESGLTCSSLLFETNQ